MAATVLTGKRRSRTGIAVAALFVLLVGAIAWDTTVVQIGSDRDARQQAFNPDAFGQVEFPRIRDAVIARAADAPDLAAQIAADRAAAIAAHGIPTATGGFMAVRLTGVVGEGRSGNFDVAIDGMPEGARVRVQTGPAINGTELRDITGDIEFGAFRNQIEYQDAGSGINRAMAAEALAGLDRDTLTGRTVTVVGVFNLINPASWLVTPVRFEVE